MNEVADARQGYYDDTEWQESRHDREEAARRRFQEGHRPVYLLGLTVLTAFLVWAIGGPGFLFLLVVEGIRRHKRPQSFQYLVLGVLAFMASLTWVGGILGLLFATVALVGFVGWFVLALRGQ